MKSTQSPDFLQKPGAGLPLFERLVARYFFLPVKSRQTTWEQSHRFFERETEKIMQLTQGLSLERLQTPVLIKRIVGIEDSSRFWSPAMVLEHLMIVAPAMSRVIVELSRGVVPHVEVDIANVKPQAEMSPEKLSTVREAFFGSMQTVKRQLTEEVKNRTSRARLRHPWFGPLSAREWNWLLASHQRIHRRQIEEIQKTYRG